MRNCEIMNLDCLSKKNPILFVKKLSFHCQLKSTLSNRYIFAKEPNSWTIMGKFIKYNKYLRNVLFPSNPIERSKIQRKWKHKT